MQLCFCLPPWMALALPCAMCPGHARSVNPIQSSFVYLWLAGWCSAGWIPLFPHPACIPARRGCRQLVYFTSIHPSLSLRAQAQVRSASSTSFFFQETFSFLLLVLGTCLDCFKVLSFFTFSITSIFGRMYGALNVGKKLTNYTVWL